MEKKITKKIEEIFKKNNWEISDFNVTKPTNIEFGEFTTNIALISSKKLGINSQQIAEIIKNEFQDFPNLKEIKIMGPGFINFYLNNDYYSNIIETIIKEKEFGRKPKNNITINNEYVSANPTGFLHVAHARGASLGDSLSNVLDYAGYNVIREYYINDYGNQIDRLAISIYVRYHQEFGVDMELPEDSYGGQDIVWGAQEIIKKHKEKFLNVPYENCKDKIKSISTSIMLEKIKKDLELLGVKFDIWFSEKSLYDNKEDEKQIKNLKGTYKKDGALWLETTKYGDDKDRVLIKSSGESTYFFSDTMYHVIKASRTPQPKYLINIWGADHIGYIKRVETSLLLQGFDTELLNVITVQLVKLIKNGEELKMSKRKGTSLWLSELVEQVGRDTTRFFLVNRSNNSSIDFNIDLANLKTNDNPAFIVQYAHARIHQLVQKSKYNKQSEFKNLNYTTQEFPLINLMNKFPELINQVSQNYKIHLITQYLIDLAGEYNSFYSNSKIIGSEREKELIALSIACGKIIKIALNLIGVSAPKKM